MAFPIPSDLPRKDDARDVSTQILTKISETPSKSLNARLASAWIAELDSTIGLTKTRIHERLSSDLPNFDRQLVISISVQERLRSLSSNIDILREQVNNPEVRVLHRDGQRSWVRAREPTAIMFDARNGRLIQTLVDALIGHSTLSQEVSDARVQHDAVAHLIRCRDELQRLTRLVDEAELSDATAACASLDGLIAASPGPLLQSSITADLKRKSTALRNRTEEQLLDAYSRSIVLSASEISIKPSVQAVLPRRWVHAQGAPSLISGDNIGTAIGLSAILASMAPSVLSLHFSTLRRDIVTHGIEYTLKQPVQIDETASHDLTGIIEHKLSFQRAPPTMEDLMSRVSHLTTVMAFLSTNLFPHFPPTERESFPLSLCTPIRTALLNHLLLPNLPSSLEKLPEFLKLSIRAVQAEDEIVVKMLGDNGADRGVKAWVDGIGLHYERKRRAEMLDKARVIAASDSAEFRVEVPLVIEEKSHNNGTSKPAAFKEDVDAWGLGDDTSSQSDEALTDEWGFDEVEPEPTFQQPEPAPTSDQPPEDSDDPWGLQGDAEPNEVDDSAWDDAWDEKLSVPEPAPAPVPKQAKGLEKKFTSKSTPQSPAFPPPASVQSPPAPIAPATRSPSQPPPSPPRESYIVSGRTKEILQLVEDVLREGAELVTSGILNAYASGTPGNVLMQAAPMALELFRALVPVVHSVPLKQSAKAPMRFSNDCLYVGQELGRMITSHHWPETGARDKLQGGLESLRILAGIWFDDAIAEEERAVDELLEPAGGFIDTTQQDRYDECESAVNEVLRRIRRVAPQWKAVLTKSKYYDALGSLVEAALSRILGDVLALEDITEVESHRLSELCRILNGLEGLFIEDPDQPSFVVSYVPSWLKFSYLSELLEASIADISYLFEEGALVDFDIEELVKLMRALFADTPLRTNTMNRLLKGHPVHN